MKKRTLLQDMQKFDLDNGTSTVRELEMVVDGALKDAAYSLQFWNNVGLYGAEEALLYAKNGARMTQEGYEEAVKKLAELKGIYAGHPRLEEQRREREYSVLRTKLTGKGPDPVHDSRWRSWYSTGQRTAYSSDSTGVQVRVTVKSEEEAKELLELLSRLTWIERVEPQPASEG